MQFDHAVVHDFEGATRNFEQIAAAGMYVCSGVPTFQAQKGNWCFRTDTGASGSGIMYRNTADGSNWVDVSTYGLQLLSPQKLRHAIGTANMPFAGGAGPVTVVVAHGLGAIPSNIQATYSYAGNTGLWITEQAADATNITFRGLASAAVAGNVGFYWEADG